jgi:6-phospho-beta-glucosidase
MSLPKNFLWGGSVAASQCEGAYREDGKGLCSADILHGGKKTGGENFLTPRRYAKTLRTPKGFYHHM